MPKERVAGLSMYPGMADAVLHDVIVGWDKDFGPVTVTVGGGKPFVEHYYGHDELTQSAVGSAVISAGLATPTEDRAALGRKVITAVAECLTDSHGGHTGMSRDLDRNQINRLIAVLRRARDAAYGRDQ